MAGVSVAKLAFSKEATLNSPAITGAVESPVARAMKAREAISDFFILLVPSTFWVRFVVPMVRR